MNTTEEERENRRGEKGPERQPDEEDGEKKGKGKEKRKTASKCKCCKKVGTHLPEQCWGNPDIWVTFVLGVLSCPNRVRARRMPKQLWAGKVIAHPSFCVAAIS